MHERAARLADAAQRPFDLIIIGGGINGAGIARDAADRGLRVLLLDQHDWGFGTTWRSTKLIHGGLRYLEHGEVPLVFESLCDRAVLLRTAAHLVQPLPLLLPVYRGDRHGRALLRLGLTAYDLLASGGGLPRHRALSGNAAIDLVPELERGGLRGALGYWDSQVALPERLCLENVLRAQESGAATFSYARVEGLLRQGTRIAGVTATDLIGGGTYTFRASVVVNAAGPWVDQVLGRAHVPAERLGGTRGTHLVVRFPGGGPARALYAEARQDRRPFFIIPWRGVHLIGTTDVRASSPDDLLPSNIEIAYLREATDALLPGARLADSDIWYSYAGIRPLPRAEGVLEGAITRRHHIVDHRGEGFAGLLSVIGGKLSTYRTLADQVTHRVGRMLGKALPATRTAHLPLVPGDWRPSDDSAASLRLWEEYGPRAPLVLDALRDDPALAAPLCPHTCETVAQAVHAIRAEGALTVADVLLRRTPAGWARCLGIDAAATVASLLASEHRWNAASTQTAIDAYTAEVRDTFRHAQSPSVAYVSKMEPHGDARITSVVDQTRLTVLPQQVPYR